MVEVDFNPVRPLGLWGTGERSVFESVKAIDRLRLSVLIDNSPKYDSYLKGCFGLSLWLEGGSEEVEWKILFDVGPLAEPLLYNADLMGIDIGDVDMIVLSHSHFDHTAALADVLRYLDREVPILAHPGIFDPSFVLRPRYMDYGMTGDNRRSRLEDLGARFLLTRSSLEVYPGLMFSGEIARTNDFERSGAVSCYTLDEDGCVCPHAIADDAALGINLDGRGLVVVTGCAHAGPINTIEHLRSVSGVGEVEGVAGGFHLLQSEGDRVHRTILKLRGLSPRWLAPMHCTGLVPMASMALAFPDDFEQMNAGDEVSWH